MTDLLQANRDAGIREAECEKAAMDVKYSTDTKIEDNSRAFKLQKANFDMEVNTAVRWKTIYFKNICIFLRATVCWQLCLCRPFMIFEGCLISTQSAAVASNHATNFATHPPILATHPQT